MSIARRTAATCLQLTKSSLQVSRNPILRNYATAAVAEKKPGKSEKPVESTSFVMNLFRGVLKPNEVFPYPSGMMK